MKQNKINKITITVLLILLLTSVGLTQTLSEKFNKLNGSYLGQTPPGETAELFAPGLISTGLYERDFTMPEDGQEIYFGIFYNQIVTIVLTKQVNGKWMEPRVAPFAQDFNFGYFEPAVTLDGQRIFCCSTKNRPGEEPLPGYGHQNIWAVDRQENGSWGELYPLDRNVNSDEFLQFFPSVTRDGTLYFTARNKTTREMGIYRSKYVDGKYLEAEPLPKEVNDSGDVYNAFIDPDEKYLLACVGGRDDSITPGQPNYYIFFRNADDTWTTAINLGERVNFSGFGAIAQSVSPDGKYLFFASSKTRSEPPESISLEWMKEMYSSPQNGYSDIYWISTSFFNNLKSPNN